MKNAARAILVLVALLGTAQTAGARPAPQVAQATPPLLLGFVSPAGNDANACTHAAPCRSLDRAYHAVVAGGIVVVGGGQYPQQVIGRDPAKASSSANVIFVPAPFARHSIEKVMLGDPNDGVAGPSHITMIGLSAKSFEAFSPSSHIAWFDLDAGNFYLRGVQHLLIKGGDWGPCNAADPNCGGNSKIDEPGIDGTEQPNDDITIDGAVFHDYRIPTFSDYHFECLFIAAGTNITIRNSRFYGCEFYDIFLQHFDSPITKLTLQNNWFDAPWNGQNVQDRNSAIGFSPRQVPFTDVLIRFNSFAPGTGIAYNDDEGDPSVYERFRVVGNLIGTANYCNAAISFEYNVIGDGFCGPTDRPGPIAYAGGSRSPWGFSPFTPRPLPGSAGIDLVPGSTADQRLSVDMEGTPRPAGAARDAGAIELRGGGGSRDDRR
jgi:hypothetical protein